MSVDDDVIRDVTGSGGDRKAFALPPRVADVLRQMSPYSDRLSWTLSEDSCTVSLALVWDLRSSSSFSSWRRSRWLRPPATLDSACQGCGVVGAGVRPKQPGPHTPEVSDDLGLLQKLKRRLDRPARNTVTSPEDDEEETVPAHPGRGRKLLRRCVTSLTALRLWRTRHSQSSPALSTDRLNTTTTKQQQQQQLRQRQQTLGDDDFFSRSRFSCVVQVGTQLYKYYKIHHSRTILQP